MFSLLLLHYYHHLRVMYVSFISPIFVQVWTSGDAVRKNRKSPSGGSLAHRSVIEAESVARGSACGGQKRKEYERDRY